jgi:hypothetical protein
MLSSLNDYVASLPGLVGGGTKAGKPAVVELDEFGRDKNYSLNQTRELRREARLTRRRKVRARLGPQCKGTEAVEAEAILSGGEDRWGGVTGLDPEGRKGGEGAGGGDYAISERWSR